MEHLNCCLLKVSVVMVCLVTYLSRLMTLSNACSLLYSAVMCRVCAEHLFLCCSQPLTAMPECSQTPRSQRPDYLADFSSGSSEDNSCSSSNEEEEEETRKTEEVGIKEKRGEKKVSYDLSESKEKNMAERSGRAKGLGLPY